MIHWLLHFTGADNVSGPWYGFWSGYGGQLTPNPYWLIAVVVLVRHRNCHVKGCWRLGHADPKHGHPACRRHHSQTHKL